MNFSKFDYRMFEAARKVAESSTYEGHSLGCVITYKKHIISSAANSNKSHPAQKKYNKRYRNFNKSEKPILDKGHAEMLALAEIPYPIAQSINWGEVHVYVYRICKGKPLGMGNSRPCAACEAALRDKGIRHIYYSGDSSFVYERLY